MYCLPRKDTSTQGIEATKDATDPQTRGGVILCGWFMIVLGAAAAHRAQEGDKDESLDYNGPEMVRHPHGGVKEAVGHTLANATSIGLEIPHKL